MSYVSLVVFLALVAIVAVAGSMFMPGEWYLTLNKPSWNPPAWLFGPVWTVLYIMIAIAGWLVWKERGLQVVLLVWGAQLVLNALWSYLAFGLNRLDLAFYDICALLGAIVLFMLLGAGISRNAVLLFAPYLAWVSFAAYLNWTLWRLNP